MRTSWLIMLTAKQSDSIKKNFGGLKMGKVLSYYDASLCEIAKKDFQIIENKYYHLFVNAHYNFNYEVDLDAQLYSNVSFHDNNLEIIKLPNFSSDLVEDIKKDINKALKLEKLIQKKYYSDSSDSTNPLSLYYGAGFFFTPSLLKILINNKDYLYQKAVSYFNNVDPNLYASIFVVHKKAGNTATAKLHNDYNNIFQGEYKYLDCLPNVTFLHIALTDNNLQTGPVVFYDSEPRVITPRYAFNYLDEKNAYLKNDRDFTLKILKISELSLEGVKDLPLLASTYILGKYYEEKYCNEDEQYGKYAELEEGEAIFFSPYRLHGTLQSDKNNNLERISVVLRLVDADDITCVPMYRSITPEYGLERIRILKEVFELSDSDLCELYNCVNGEYDLTRMNIISLQDKEKYMSLSSLENFYKKFDMEQDIKTKFDNLEIWNVTDDVNDFKVEL